jgi:steroid 5-alpha reductase family enzyme
MTANLPLICAVVIIYVTIGFGLAVLLRRNDVADAMWSGGIFLASSMAVYSSGHHSTSHPLVDLLCALIFIWAVRLSWQIGNRFVANDQEDFRYANWRRTWRHFYLRSYVQVFLLQGSLMIAVAMVVIAPTYFVDATDYSPTVVVVGLVVFAVGLICETLADLQLNAFLRTSRKLGEFLQTGLWAYSRHPNYFGEVTLWWGLFLIAIAPAVPNGLLGDLPVVLAALISPVSISALILFVSGIPALEAKRQGDPAFERYKQKVSAFIPWFPDAAAATGAAHDDRLR